MNPILQKMYNLPPELRAIIEGNEVIDIINKIGEKHDIPDAWRGELTKATVRVLSGFMRPEEFIPFIMDEYLIDQDDALHIALDINAAIFSVVKPQLASLHKIEDEKIARRVRVPRKPREFQISKEVNLLPEQGLPVAPSVDPAPAEQLSSVLEYGHTEAERAPGSLPSPLTTHFSSPASIVATPPAPTARPIIQTPLDSPLTSKLGGMRQDSYREKI